MAFVNGIFIVDLYQFAVAIVDLLPETKSLLMLVHLLEVPRLPSISARYPEFVTAATIW